jgi:D-tagatose-1,6-bisphosphate aldolase subunit GatZ/KbaZ
MILDDLVGRLRSGERIGITSICSAHPFVIDAAMRNAGEDGYVLVESTCNQVNQYGGYTGMTPDRFVDYLMAEAKKVAFPLNRLITGGDHLGPNVWKNETAKAAMDKSKVLVRDYVRAGYRKIHLDTSMHCSDDERSQPLSVETIAARTAELAVVAEAEASDSGVDCDCYYVIGTEVPTPGGIQGESHTLEPTPPEEVQITIDATRRAFEAHDVGYAWEHVIAVVTQPGVEFGDAVIFDYDRNAAASLSGFIAGHVGLVYEAHSTDYQTRDALRQLVEDHFAILKVGPALTFAFREAVFALEAMEQAILSIEKGFSPSYLQKTLEFAMLEHPEYWEPYYEGSEEEQAFARRYSFSDRSRYYWADKNVQQSLALLLSNLERIEIPLSLVSQFLPNAFRQIREEGLENTPQALIRSRISEVLADYSWACGRNF